MQFQKRKRIQGSLQSRGSTKAILGKRKHEQSGLEWKEMEPDRDQENR